MNPRVHLLWLAALCGACAPTYEAGVCVTDEAGVVLPGARAVVDGVARDANGEGFIRVGGLEHPAVAVVEADGFLARPVVIGADGAACVEVSLLSSAGGTRRVVHFGGDMMLGRRYEEPDTGLPLITPGDGGASARDVVADLAASFGLADLGMANLETVVGELPEEAAYPAKRWLLQTNPDSLAALDELGVDVVVLGNNHQRDWLDAGVSSTLQLVDERGKLPVGSGMSKAEAWEPLVLDVDGMRVGVVSWTSVDGEYVNDNYPTAADVAPDPLDDEDVWKWETRSWGYPELGVQLADRRLGDAWDAIEDLLGDLDDDQAAGLWTSAEAVYPELQDWVARWGHGGAARWDTAGAEDLVGELRPEVDLLVVQLHMGMQFAEVPSGAARDAARTAIDAGADIVIGHHPHVLQGLEWYKGKLIVYSLGNLVFDQDFLSTFASGYLRTVWESDGTLVQARFVPAWIDAYRPVPVGGNAARNVLRTVWDRGLLGATAKRGDDLVPRAVAEPPDEGTSDVELRYEHGTAVILDVEDPATSVQLAAVSEMTELPPDGLIRRSVSEAPPDGLLVGRDLLGAGDFEDEDTDASIGDARVWTWESSDVRLTDVDPGQGKLSLELVRDPNNVEVVQARPVARVELDAHRVYADEDGEQPLDGAATFSVTMLAWADGELGTGSIRLTLYHFDDTDPTDDPDSVTLADLELDLPLDELGAWQRVTVDLPAGLLDPVDGLVPNAALLYVRNGPPQDRTTVLRLDDIEIVEWRPAAGAPEGFMAADWLRWPGQAGWLEIERLPW
jgi:poly-gamma-glutamate capsule biosynthesis protein CapA/YwtB (metallophosphatase superfamily)